MSRDKIFILVTQCGRRHVPLLLELLGHPRTTHIDGAVGDKPRRCRAVVRQLLPEHARSTLLVRRLDWLPDPSPMASRGAPARRAKVLPKLSLRL